MDAQVAAKQPGDPRRFGPYELVGRLGQGGMGVVFLGRERRTGRLAAVKALRPELAGGIVHRDLKPTNVLLSKGSRVAGVGTVRGQGDRLRIAWAADATMTRSGLRFGTPSWMAPEQLRDQPAGPPADVFAWGALAAFAATGRHPFGGGPADAVAYRILHHQPDLDGVPEALRRLVRDALSRDPAARPTAIRIFTDLAAAGPPTRPLPMVDPTQVLPGAVGNTLLTDGPTAMTAGPTRRRRGRRAGRLLLAAALLAGLVAAPQVVLATVDGAPESSSQHEHTTKRCPGDEEDGAAAGHDPEDAEEQEAAEEERDEDEDEDEREEQEEDSAAAKDRRGDREPGTAGSRTGCGATASHRPPSTCTTPAANPLLPPTQPPPPTRPPSTHPPTGDPGSRSGNDVLGS